MNLRWRIGGIVWMMLFFQFSYGQEGLRKLSNRERLDYARNGKFPTNATIYRDTAGNVLRGFSLKNPVIQHEIYIGYDYYVNATGKITQIVVRKAGPADKELYLKLFDLEEERYRGTLETVQIDCSNQRDVLIETLKKDRNNRRENGLTPDPGVDRQNEATITSLLKQCGPPTHESVGDTAIKAIYFVILHGSRLNQEKYFPLIRLYTEKGILRKRDPAVLEDKLLKASGEKQKYGSQVNYSPKTGYELYPIDDPDHVDERRAAVGLPPLEEFLKGLEEFYEMKIRR
jgi:hypothetical protein